MKRHIPFFLLLAGPHAAAQDADYELVTTAMHTVRSETALPITVMSGEELHRASRATIGETLANQPGINNASFGPAVGQTVIRGQAGRRVLNLSNGLANADASGSSADHAVAVEPILADAVEVLRGPSTLLYGGGAIGGVVNIIDNRVPRTLSGVPAFSLEARHDSAAEQNAYVGRLEFDTGNLAWHFDGMHRDWNNLDIPGHAIDNAYLEPGHDNPDGFIPNTGGKTGSFTAGSSWIFDSGFIGLAVNRLDNTYGLPGGAHAEGEADVFIDMGSTRVDLTGEWRNPYPWLEHVDLRMAYTDYSHAEMEGPGNVGTQFSNESWQQRLQLTLVQAAPWHGVLGLQNSSETFGAVGEESFIPVTDISARGLFLVEDYHGDGFTVELGARLNNDDYSPQQAVAPARDFTTFSFSASTLWDLNAVSSLGLILSHSQRAPSIEELYSNVGLASLDQCVIHNATGACETGDTGFGKESSNNVDLTLSLDKGGVSASFTLFYNDFSDYIALVNTGRQTQGAAVRDYRQLDARFSGLEVDLTFMLNDYLDLQVFGDSIHSHLAEQGDAPRMPPTRFGSRLNYDGGDWNTYLSVMHARAQDDPGRYEIRTGSYTRWDAGVEYNMPVRSSGEILLFLRGRNLGNDDIRLATSYLRGFAPEAGRSVEAGVRFSY